MREKLRARRSYFFRTGCWECDHARLRVFVGLFVRYSWPSDDSGVALSVVLDVPSVTSLRDFLLSLGMVVLSEGESSIVVGDAVSP